MAVINPHTTRATGTILTAAIYNADHQNHITNATNLNVALLAIGGVSLVTGFVVNNGAGIFSGRTLQAGTGIDITNPDGLAGDPTILIEPNVALPGNASSVGSFTVGTTLSVTGVATMLNTLVLKASAVPVPTTEGGLEWDNDGDYLVAGDGAAQKFIGRAPVITRIIANGATWTKTPGARFLKLRGCGAGAGGGDVNGIGAGNGGAGGGGGSAFAGEILGLIDISAIASAVCTIGAGGAGGIGSGAGGSNGGNTAITLAGTTYTFGGGFGGGGLVANGTIGGSQDGGQGGVGTNVVGGSQPGGIGVYNGNGSNNGTGGNGGYSPWGVAPKGVHIIAASFSSGSPASGFGAGGAGGVSCGVATNALGGNGAPGMLLFEEIF